MKTIGMLGGMSWESTASYYRLINQAVRQALGGLHSAKIILHSMDFEEIAGRQRQGKWDEMADLLSAAARAVEAGGADLLLICTNTMHKLHAEIQAAVSIPVLHIADATAECLIADGIGRVGLLGTRFTMEQTFYKNRLKEKFAIDVIVPDAAQQGQAHDIIFSELCVGVTREESRQRYLAIIDRLLAQGAEAVVLGCTEISLLIEQQHSAAALYDTTVIHARKAVALALADA